MKNILNYNKLIGENAAALSGVFTYADLAAITNISEKTLLPRRIRQLEEAGILVKFMRGIYIYEPAFNPQMLSQRLAVRSYISLETVLAANLVIGTIPAFRITAVKIGRSRFYESKHLTIEHLSIQGDLFFGFNTDEGICTADPEKAFLDTLYYYQKGRSPSFNIYEDVNLKRLDLTKVASYLKRFKNPKFVAFVNSLIEKG